QLCLWVGNHGIAASALAATVFNFLVLVVCAFVLLSARREARWSAIHLRQHVFNFYVPLLVQWRNNLDAEQAKPITLSLPDVPSINLHPPSAVLGESTVASAPD